jgi:maltose alpha-D-glucosyltransferase/alpha-amylase
VSQHGTLPDDPLWYKDAVFYELRVRSFFDSDGDGIGDFRGLTEKLDYLEDLGVTALWLLPFYPSPLRDDGYDISDYRSVHPECGTLADFRRFLREAHRRGLRVVTELVLNHTSDQHPWFQRARRAPPGSRYRDYYLWSDTAREFRDARIIFQDFEPSNWTWDPIARAHFWHRFYSHQPDLNFRSAEVRRELFRVVDFWLRLGVDGLRLDAVPYLYEREGTNCENLPETHALLRELRQHIDRRFKNRMLLAEANQWPEDAVAYLADGVECQMAFHFPLMPRLFLGLRIEDRFPITDIWAQTPELHPSCQWALFLRNHDELTLEMVTDEERDTMVRAYAQEKRMRINLGIRRRLAPLLGGNRRTLELLNALLLSLPGTPVIYYGDEIGMGDNVYLGDRNGVRTPMQWSADRNAGFSRAKAQQLVLPPVVDHEFHYEAVNVEAQQNNRHSLLWWMKRLIALRSRFQAFGRGTIRFLAPSNSKVLAFVREHGDERVLVVANLSRFVQLVRLDLSEHRGLVPVELFGRTAFPRIGERSYDLTLGPHGFYWFSLERDQTGGGIGAAGHRPPSLQLRKARSSHALRDVLEAVEDHLAPYLQRCRWFGAKSQKLRSTSVVDTIPLPGLPETAICLIQAELEDESETYLLPLSIARGEKASEVRARWPQAVVADLELGSPATQGVLFDALADSSFCDALLQLIRGHRRLRGEHGSLQAAIAPKAEIEAGLRSRVVGVEQSNTSVVFEDRLILKLYRKLADGISPELELCRFLSGRYPHTPALAGWLEYRASEATEAEPTTIAILQRFVPNHGDAWAYTLAELRRFFERVLAKRERVPVVPRGGPLAMIDAQAPAVVLDMVGAYLDAARLLGRRTGELHLALGSWTESSAFAAEPYTALYQRSVYQSLRNLSGGVIRLLRRGLPSLPEAERRSAQRFLKQQAVLTRQLDRFLHARLELMRIRTHGDLHLGQVLSTGKDFVLIDFEGEPARPLADRRRKRAALRDVAGMIRSFHYAARTGLLESLERFAVAGRQRERLERWAECWQAWSVQAYLRGYLETVKGSPILPAGEAELGILLETFLLEKALYEVAYELNNRPDWVGLPLHGLEELLAR